MAQVSTFRIGQALYGIDILHAKEISKIFEITPVPEAPPHIVGLMNLRGQIVSIIAPSQLWGQELGTDLRDCRLLILKTDEQIKPLIERNIIDTIKMGKDYLGFIINEVCNVIEYQPPDIAPPPPHLEIRDFVRGILQLETEVVTVFNTEKLLERAVGAEASPIAKNGPDVEGKGTGGVAQDVG